MEILAHTLWTTAGARKINANLKKKGKKTKINILWAAFWGIFPDLFAFSIPFILTFYKVFTGEEAFGSIDAQHKLADQFNLSHYLYQYSHSIIIWALIFFVVWIIWKRSSYSLFGWLFHIILDIPSHSLAFFPTPFLFPILGYHFPYGISWGTPWFMIVNYLALLFVWGGILIKKNRKKLVNNKTKAILFDLDGLIILGNKKLFSQRFSEKENIPMEKVSEFFLNDFRECSFGKADLKERLAPYLIKWGYKGTTPDLLKFWFESENNINKKVLEIVKDLRSKNIKCYIATRQEKYRKDYIWNGLGLKNEFDDIFCTCDIGYDKSEKEYWDYVFNELKLKPEEIMFFCDSQKNVDKANNSKIEAYYYKGISGLKEKLNGLIT